MYIPASDPRLTYCGAVSIQSNDNWTRLWRAPWNKIELFPEDMLNQLYRPAGARVRFVTNSVNLKLRPAPLQSSTKIDLVIDNEIVETVEANVTDTEFVFSPLSGEAQTIELWLSQSVPIDICGISIDEGATLEKSEDRRPKWITYGSSITACGAAASPATTWPAIVARSQNLNLTCLGFGGQCHADPMILKMIRDMPADIISMCLGINIQGRGSFNRRSFRPMVIGAIMTIREKHPDTPLVMCSPIYCPNRENHGNGPDGLSLKEMREEISEAVKICQKQGDKKLFYINGLDLFDVELAEYLPDDLHPNADGYRILGENFLREVFELSDIGKLT